MKAQHATSRTSAVTCIQADDAHDVIVIGQQSDRQATKVNLQRSCQPPCLSVM